MQNDEIHKLAVLLDEGLNSLSTVGNCETVKNGEEEIKVIELRDWVDYLLKNGVTVQPCRAGEPVYFIFFDDERGIWDYCESEIKDVCNRGIFTSPFTDEREDDPESWQLIKFGTEDMFFTREEAEKAISGKELMPG